MSGFKLKKRKQVSSAFDINVTPMLDLFSVLIIFLLATAVFSATGEMRIEVPFLSSKPPPPQKELDKNPEKTVNITVDEKTVSYQQATTASSVVQDKLEVPLTEEGLDRIQAKIYEIRKQDPKFDKVTVFTQAEVKYEDLVLVLESMRELRPPRKPIPFPDDYKMPSGFDPENPPLVTKIVLGNVIFAD
ncbi:MAG: Biopolymer transport protein ExbD/TolR [Pseudomonadota bacterium]|jgi:biopolymer transport protein ExbD